MEQCPSLPKDDVGNARLSFLGALFAAVAPKLVDGAIDAASGALKAAGEDKATSSTSRVDGYFYRVGQQADLLLNAPMGCVVAVRGRFGAGDSKGDLSWANDAASTRGMQDVIFRLEAQMQPIKGLKHFQLQPVYLEVKKFEEKSWFGKAYRDYSLALTLKSLGAAAPFGSAAFLFKELTEGKVLKADDWRLASSLSEPIPFPAEAADAERARVSRAKVVAPYQLALGILTATSDRPAPRPMPTAFTFSDIEKSAQGYCSELRDHNALVPKQFAINDERCAYKVDQARRSFEYLVEKMPLRQAVQDWAKEVCGPVVKGTDSKEDVCTNFSNDSKLTTAQYGFFSTFATLVETRPGSKFAALLGTALGAAKADLSNAITTRMVPDKNEAAEELAARGARRGLALADLGVTQAEESLAEVLMEASPKPSAVTAARLEVVKAKIAANDAYRAAGQAIPYPELD